MLKVDMRKGRSFITLALMASVAVVSSGCVLVPFVQAFKEAGATEGDRMALLPDQIKKFNSAVVFGNRMEAMQYVASDSQNKIAEGLKDNSEEERVVDSKVSNVIWADSAREATVEIKVKYFKVPVYIVNTRVEEQRWVFSVGDGWKLADRTLREG
jgi:hypothetical protein